MSHGVAGEGKWGWGWKSVGSHSRFQKSGVRRARCEWGWDEPWGKCERLGNREGKPMGESRGKKLIRSVLGEGRGVRAVWGRGSL